MAFTSIVDYLNSIGQDSSYAARKQLAAQNGISGYSGTATQNENLLKILQNNQNNQSSPTSSTATQTTSGVSDNVKAGTTDANFKKSDSTNSYYTQLQAAESNKPSAYETSDTVNDYYERLQEQEANKPDAYESKYTEQIDSILNSILNNKQFSYTADDLANDELYQMYRENYTRQGDLAMRDTMGNAAALTGGYGSTYASAAGQQAYDNYLSQLNDLALEFSDRAYQQYLNEQSERYNQLGAVTGLDETDYSRYRDTVNDYYTDLNYLAGRYDQEYAKDYGEYRDSVSDYYTNLDYLAGMYDTEWSHDMSEYQTNLSREQWAEEFAFQQAQAAQEQANWEAEMALARSKAASSSGSSSTSSKSKSTTSAIDKKYEDYTYYDYVKRLQQLKDEGKAGDVEAFNVANDWYMRGYITLEEMHSILEATNTTWQNTKTAKGVMS